VKTPGWFTEAISSIKSDRYADITPSFALSRRIISKDNSSLKVLNGGLPGGFREFPVKCEALLKHRFSSGKVSQINQEL